MATILNFLNRIVFGGQSLIQKGFAQTELFPNYGKNAWLGKIHGTDPETTFIREFIEKDWDDAKKNGTAGLLCFRGLSTGLYEFRKFAVSNDPANCKVGGFVLMTDAGVLKVSKDAALKIAKLLDDETWEELEAEIDLDSLLHEKPESVSFTNQPTL